MADRTDTYTLGKGKLITPDGREYEVSEVTFRWHPAPEIKNGQGVTIHRGPYHGVDITFKEAE